MSEFDDVLGADGSDESEGMKNLRNAHKKEKEAREKLEKQLRDLVVKDLVKERGLNPKVASLIPASVEASETALGKWFEDNADIFAPASTPKPPAVQEQPPTEAQDTQQQAPQTPNIADQLSPDVLASLQQIISVAGQTQLSTQLQEAQVKLQGAASKEDFYSRLQNM